MSVELPQLLDCRALMAELGVKRHAAEQIMRHVPKVEIDGMRKVYVRRADVRAYLDACTRSNDQAPRVA